MIRTARRVLIASTTAASAALAALAASPASAALTVFTTRAAWEAALAGSSIQNEPFTGVAAQNITALSTQLGLITLDVDRLSASPSSNPAIINFGGSFGQVLSLNAEDPTAPFPQGGPTLNTLSFGGPINAFAADFFQLGVTVGSTTQIGDITLALGGETVVINPSLAANGNGFFGVVSTGAGSNITLSFVRSGGLGNDTFQMDNVAFNIIPTPGSISLAIAAVVVVALGRRRS